MKHGKNKPEIMKMIAHRNNEGRENAGRGDAIFL
jgi:hypothetical protein